MIRDLGGDYPGIPGWTLNTITCIPTKREMGKFDYTENRERFENTGLKDCSHSQNASSHQNCKDSPLVPPEGEQSC